LDLTKARHSKGVILTQNPKLVEVKSALVLFQALMRE